VLGDGAMQRMAKSSILLYGVGGLGIEIGKILFTLEIGEILYALEKGKIACAL